ncbi:uncharacterized protein [Periplaneta americana]|uniref:uncharacterized protein isoform X2 n=1 Tax=Periplaneta americana TaxID=6978 RepID=UPI0037E7130B
MENVWHFVRLYLGLLFLKLCCGYPIDLESADVQNVSLLTTFPPFLAVAFLVTTVVVLMGCVCCRQNKGFQEFTDSTSSHSLSGAGGYVNSAASTTEFTIFPPAQATAVAATASSNRLSVPGDRSSVVRFEPLPDIRPQVHSRRPAAFNNAVSHGLSSQDWFQDPHVNFPRQQLKYLRELGRGWFGRVVEGEAQSIVPEQKTSKVVVKILHEDATTTDQMYFLHEAKPYRELNHPNVLKLLGRCLETDPFLVLLEACPSGDLKSFLSQNIATAEALNQQGVTLQMCCNIASGLLHMHDNGFVHTDLAARNCLVTPDLSIKIGDYGTSIETFKEDYYCAGEVALPIRWCAPETLHCTETTIETKEVTASANVWSLGVVFWEIFEFGKLPYSDLSDDEVIVKVLGEGTQRLDQPSLACPQRQNLYLLMKLCWSHLSERPVLLQVHSMLNHLYTNRERYSQDGDNSSLKTDEDFEHRWEMFKPNSIPKTDNHVTSPESTPVMQSPTRSVSEENSSSVLHASQLEDGTPQRKSLILPPAAFDSGNLTVDGSNTTPLTTSPQPSLASSSGGEFFIPSLQQRHKSPSLQNLRGSVDDLTESTMTNWQKSGEGDEVDQFSDVVEEKESEETTLDEEKNTEVKETITLEPDFDSWLKGVETTNEEDAKFVRKISEAIRDLDNALALEKTSSSSSSEASSKSVSHQSPAKDTTTILSEQNVVLDFRLGRADSGVSSDDKEMMFQPDSFQDDSYMENAKSIHLENRATDSGTDTEDETWRRRIERGEFSEKVKEKSKSVADLMVLTHIECSDGSDSDTPSLTWCFERSSNGRGSFSTRLRAGSFNKNAAASFSSESNIHGAVLGEEFRDTLKKLHEAQKESSSVLQRKADACNIHSSNHNRGDNFLAIDASEEINRENGIGIATISNKDLVKDVALLLSSADGKLGSEIDSVEKRVLSHFSEVPDKDSVRSSVSTPNHHDNKDCKYNAFSEVISVDAVAIPHEDETVRSVTDSLSINVPHKVVIEPSVSNASAIVETPNVTLFTSDDSFERFSGDEDSGKDSSVQNEYNQSPLFTSTPHRHHNKVGTDVSEVLDYSVVSDMQSVSNSSHNDVTSDSFRFSLKNKTNISELETKHPVTLTNERAAASNEEKSHTSVVLGPCEDYTLDYFKGLKTTSGDVLLEDISSENSPVTVEHFEEKQESLDMDYCIDSWDKHLATAFQEHEAEADFYDDISFKSGADSFTDEEDHSVAIVNRLPRDASVNEAINSNVSYPAHDLSTDPQHWNSSSHVNDVCVNTTSENYDRHASSTKEVLGTQTDIIKPEETVHCNITAQQEIGMLKSLVGSSFTSTETNTRDKEITSGIAFDPWKSDNVGNIEINMGTGDKEVLDPWKSHEDFGNECATEQNAIDEEKDLLNAPKTFSEVEKIDSLSLDFCNNISDYFTDNFNVQDDNFDMKEKCDPNSTYPKLGVQEFKTSIPKSLEENLNDDNTVELLTSEKAATFALCSSDIDTDTELFKSQSRSSEEDLHSQDLSESIKPKQPENDQSLLGDVHKNNSSVPMSVNIFEDNSNHKYTDFEHNFLDSDKESTELDLLGAVNTTLPIISPNNMDDHYEEAKRDTHENDMKKHFLVPENLILVQKKLQTPSLCIPSLNVIAATPVPSGRNTPEEMKEDIFDNIYGETETVELNRCPTSVDADSINDETFSITVAPIDEIGSHEDIMQSETDLKLTSINEGKCKEDTISFEADAKLTPVGEEKYQKAVVPLETHVKVTPFDEESKEDIIPFEVDAKVISYDEEKLQEDVIPPETDVTITPIGKVKYQKDLTSLETNVQKALVVRGEDQVNVTDVKVSSVEEEKNLKDFTLCETYAQGTAIDEQKDQDSLTLLETDAREKPFNEEKDRKDVTLLETNVRIIPGDEGKSQEHFISLERDLKVTPFDKEKDHADLTQFEKGVSVTPVEVRDEKVIIPLETDIQVTLIDEENGQEDLAPLETDMKVIVEVKDQKEIIPLEGNVQATTICDANDQKLLTPLQVDERVTPAEERKSQEDLTPFEIDVKVTPVEEGWNHEDLTALETAVKITPVEEGRSQENLTTLETDMKVTPVEEERKQENLIPFETDVEVTPFEEKKSQVDLTPFEIDVKVTPVEEQKSQVDLTPFEIDVKVTPVEVGRSVEDLTPLQVDERVTPTEERKSQEDLTPFEIDLRVTPIEEGWSQEDLTALETTVKITPVEEGRSQENLTTLETDMKVTPVEEKKSQEDITPCEIDVKVTPVEVGRSFEDLTALEIDGKVPPVEEEKSQEYLTPFEIDMKITPVEEGRSHEDLIALERNVKVTPVEEEKSQENLTPFEIDVKITPVEEGRSQENLTALETDVKVTPAEEEKSQKDLTPLETDVTILVEEEKSQEVLTPLETDVKVTPAEEKSQKDITPLETDVAVTLVEEEKSREDLTQFEVDAKVTPVEEGRSQKVLTPLETDVKVTPVEQGKNQEDLTALETNVKVTPVEEEKKQEDLIPLGTDVKVTPIEKERKDEDLIPFETDVKVTPVEEEWNQKGLTALETDVKVIPVEEEKNQEDLIPLGTDVKVTPVEERGSQEVLTALETDVKVTQVEERSQEDLTSLKTIVKVTPVEEEKKQEDLIPFETDVKVTPIEKERRDEDIIPFETDVKVTPIEKERRDEDIIPFETDVKVTPIEKERRDEDIIPFETDVKVTPIEEKKSQEHLIPLETDVTPAEEENSLEDVTLPETHGNETSAESVKDQKEIAPLERVLQLTAVYDTKVQEILTPLETDVKVTPGEEIRSQKNLIPLDVGAKVILDHEEEITPLETNIQVTAVESKDLKELILFETNVKITPADEGKGQQDLTPFETDVNVTPIDKGKAHKEIIPLETDIRVTPVDEGSSQKDLISLITDVEVTQVCDGKGQEDLMSLETFLGVTPVDERKGQKSPTSHGTDVKITPIYDGKDQEDLMSLETFLGVTPVEERKGQESPTSHETGARIRVHERKNLEDLISLETIDNSQKNITLLETDIKSISIKKEMGHEYLTPTETNVKVTPDDRLNLYNDKASFSVKEGPTDEEKDQINIIPLDTNFKVTLTNKLSHDILSTECPSTDKFNSTSAHITKTSETETFPITSLDHTMTNMEESVYFEDHSKVADAISTEFPSYEDIINISTNVSNLSNKSVSDSHIIADGFTNYEVKPFSSKDLSSSSESNQTATAKLPESEKMLEITALEVNQKTEVPLIVNEEYLTLNIPLPTDLFILGHEKLDDKGLNCEDDTKRPKELKVEAQSVDDDMCNFKENSILDQCDLSFDLIGRTKSDIEENNKELKRNDLTLIEPEYLQSYDIKDNILISENKKDKETPSFEISNSTQIHPIKTTIPTESGVNKIEESFDSSCMNYEQVQVGPIEVNHAQGNGSTTCTRKPKENSHQVALDSATTSRLEIHDLVQENKEESNFDLSNFEQDPVEFIDIRQNQTSDVFNEKEVITTVDSWKQNQFDKSRMLMEDFLLGERLASGLTASGLDLKTEELPETCEVEDDGEDFGLDVVKHSTPDDERSSDSGFRDKGSLSESCEDACDEKYNLEDIEAELEETYNKDGFNYVEKHDDEEQNGRASEEQQRKLSTKSSDDSAFHYIDKTEDEDQNDKIFEDIQRKLSVRSSDDSAYHRGDLEYFDSEHEESSNDRNLETMDDTVLTITDDNAEKESIIHLTEDISLCKDTNLMDVNFDSQQNKPEEFIRSENCIDSVSKKNSQGDSREMTDLNNVQSNTVINQTQQFLDFERGIQNVDPLSSQQEGNETVSYFLQGAPIDKMSIISSPDVYEKHSLDYINENYQYANNFISSIDKNTENSEDQLSESMPSSVVDGDSKVSRPDNLNFDFQRPTELVSATGWYLHPPPKGENYNVDDDKEDQGSCTSKYEESNNNENSYVSFSLDEEFVAAIRNELREKLPCTRQQSQEEDSEEDGMLDPDDDSPQEERTDIMIHYNTYPAPLSPILEERESVSSITTTISDHYSPFAAPNQADATKSGSDSEPVSPVFVLDPKETEVSAKKFEQEIREALENCSLSSEDTSSSCDKEQKASSVLFEDLEQQPSEDAQRLMLDVTVNGKNIVVVRGTNQHNDDDDLLVVNTETNEATLLESPKPKSHLAFVNNRRTSQESKSVDEISATPDFFSDDEMTVGVTPNTFIIEKNRFSDNFIPEPKSNDRKDASSDDEVYTPDSISPEHATASTLQSPDTENLSDFFLTPSEKSPTASECPNSPNGPQNSAVYNPYFLHSLSKTHDNPTFEEVQEICLGVANNEAAEIISELESSGIFNNNNNTSDKGIFTTLLPACENVSIQELPTSRTASINENSDEISVDENSESSESTKKDLVDENSGSFTQSQRLSAVDRLDYLTSPNLDVFTEKSRESAGFDSSPEEEENSLRSNSYNRKLLLNDTLDLLKRRKESQQQNSNDTYQEDEEKDWSLPNLEASLLSTKAPMPSPEEESWKQIPSMLAFSDLNEVMARCGNEKETFNALSFNGQTNCVPYGGQTEVDEGDLMSTSFSIKGDPDDPECYTPDWESDSDETNEDDNNSSSSGEFIWKPYEGLSDFPMEVIAEEEEDEDDDDDDDADGSSSSGSGAEFVPSAWNSEATPNRSALRSPDKKSDQKKNVSFKKQKYHSVYEYPRETSDSDSEGFDSPTRRHWNSMMYQSTQQPQVDYSSFADWELLDGDVLPEGSGPDTDTDQEVPENTTQQQLDFYKLSNVDYDFGNGMLSEDGEFYISSSARPFQFPGGSSDVLSNSGSQFFPGQLYHIGSECKQTARVDDITVDFVTPDSGIIDITVADKLSALEAGSDSYEDEVDTSPSNISRFSVSFSEQLAGHKTDRATVWEDETDSVKCGADESPSSSSDNGEKVSIESVKLQDLSLAESARATEPVTNGVSGSSVDRDTDTCSQSPSSPLSPSGLGELRHTRDRLKLDLPASSKAFVLDPPAVGKRRSVETVKGEASLLDSGEETEDSGIESSNGPVTVDPKQVKSPAEDSSKT